MSVPVQEPSAAGVAACECCDALYQRMPLPHKGVALCQRCGAVLYRNRPADLDLQLALTLAGLIVLVLANAYPIVEIELQGTRNEAGLWGAILAAYDSGVGLVAVVSAATLFFFPLLQLVVLLWVLLPLRNGHEPPGFLWAMHALRLMRPWSMVEVFMLGVLVSVVKLASMAVIAPGIGLWSFAVLTVIITALSTFDLDDLWDRLPVRAS